MQNDIYFINLSASERSQEGGRWRNVPVPGSVPIIISDIGKNNSLYIDHAQIHIKHQGFQFTLLNNKTIFSGQAVIQLQQPGLTASVILAIMMCIFMI